MNGESIMTLFYSIREPVLRILAGCAQYSFLTFWLSYFQPIIKASKGHLQLQERHKLQGEIWVSLALR
jgi:hypothetical protein